MVRWSNYTVSKPGYYALGVLRVLIGLSVLLGLSAALFGLPDEISPWQALGVSGALVLLWEVYHRSHPAPRSSKARSEPSNPYDAAARVRTGEASREVARAFATEVTVSRDACLGVVLADREGRLVTSNRVIQEIFGYTEEELRGMSIAELTDPGDVPISRHYLRGLFQGSWSHYELDKRYRAKDGHLVQGHLRVTCIRDERGEPRFAVGILENIQDGGCGPS